jgi:hypothetical protein
MKRGGARSRAGRPRVVSDEEVIRIGAACERVWYWLSPDYRRPYYWRPYVLLASAVHFTTELEKFVSARRIEATWKLARKAGVQRAQPGEPGYLDAKSVDAWIHNRFDSGPPIAAILDLRLDQLSILSTEF